MKMKRVLVSGCGSIGLRHLQILSERGDVQLAACDVDATRAKDVIKIDKGISFLTGPAAGLAWKPEYVIVATPNRFHCETTLGAFKVGAHVLCEKPLAHTVRDGKRMVAAAKKHGTVLAVGYTERFRPGIQRLAAMVRKGELGTLIGGRALVGTYNTLLCARTACRNDYGAILVDYTHEFDFLREFFGEVKEVSCWSNNLGKRKLLTVDPTVAVTVLQYESDALVTVHMDYVQHPERRIVEVFGDKKSAVLDLQAETLQIFDPTVEGYHTLTLPSVRNDMFRAEHEDFFTACIKGRAPRVDGEAGLRVLEIAEQAIRQSRKRRPSIHQRS